MMSPRRTTERSANSRARRITGLAAGKCFRAGFSARDSGSFGERCRRLLLAKRRARIAVRMAWRRRHAR